MKAVFCKSDWPEEFDEEILVTYLRTDESESDGILRAMELYGSEKTYFIKETIRTKF